MNRREFGKAIAAASVVPLIPTAAASAPAVQPIHLMWGEAIARAQNGVSPAHLARALNVPTDIAHAVHSQLFQKNVIRAGAARGSTQAVKPLFPDGWYRKGGETIADRALATAKSTIKDQILQPTETDDTAPHCDCRPETELKLP